MPWNATGKPVEHHNFTVLRILVEGLEAQSTPQKITDSFAQAGRLDVFNRYLSGGVIKFASTPRDLLSEDIRSDLVSR